MVPCLFRVPESLGTRLAHDFTRVDQSRSQTNDRGYLFGNETRCAHAYKIKNGVLRNGEQPGSAENTAFLTKVNLKWLECYTP